MYINDINFLNYKCNNKFIRNCLLNCQTSSLKRDYILKVPVKSKLSMCSQFVTPQKNVLLATQPNLNDIKCRQVHKITQIAN